MLIRSCIMYQLVIFLRHPVMSYNHFSFFFSLLCVAINFYHIMLSLLLIQIYYSHTYIYIYRNNCIFHVYRVINVSMSNWLILKLEGGGGTLDTQYFHISNLTSSVKCKHSILNIISFDRRRLTLCNNVAVPFSFFIKDT